MRYLGAVSVFIFALSAGFLKAVPASATTISASGEITITARVADAHYVIVDSQDNILEIISNTTQTVTPKVFRGSTDSHEIPLSKGVHEQYRQLTESKQGVIGTLYKKEARTAGFDRQPHLLLLRSNALSIVRYFH